MWEFDTDFSEIIPRTPEVKSFRFPLGSDQAPYQPGQFFFVTIKVNGQEALHHFSFSSSPTDRQYLEFTKRITGSDYSRQLNVTRPGDWAHIRGPLGSFTLPSKPQPLGFISGGIGITPMLSMLRYLTARQLPYDVVLLYGNNNYEDIAFRDELEHLKTSRHSLRVEHVLSGTDIPPGWKGKRGRINQDIVRELVPDYMKRLFYISGPPKMVVSLEEAIAGLGVPERNIRRDSFTGYD
jgi:ferredoxin-NADP reductase